MTQTVTATEKLYLVDAHAYLHRAYHALPPLTSSKGEPVGALLGFAKMLLLITRREKPDFLAVCFDMPGPTFRHKAYADYKATRKELDPDLAAQLKLALPLAEALGFACFGAPGYEADDLMATLARRGEADGLEVVLVTGDKDALQLVGGKIKVLNEAKGELMDPVKVTEKFKVQPSQIVDYLALIGDSSDNVPGVPGVGPVGAVKLLSQFKTLDKIFEAAERNDPALSPKLAQGLREAKEKALFGRTLLELDTKAPVPAAPRDCRVRGPQPETLLPLIDRFDFSQLRRELFPDASAPAPAPARAASSESAPLPPVPEPGEGESVKAWLAAATKAPSFSVAYVAAAGDAADDQPGLPLEKGWTFALSLENGLACLLEPRDVGAHLAALKKLLEDPSKTKIVHDVKTVGAALADAGLRLAGPRFDVYLAAYVVNPGAGKYGFDDVWKALGGEDYPSEEPPRQSALRQARALWPAAARLEARLRADGLRKLYDELELPLVDVLADMEAEGVGLDRKYLEALRVEFDAKLRELKSELDRLAGGELNVQSPKQLAKLLYEDLKLPISHKTAKGAPSTDEEALRSLVKLHPIPAKILDFREVAKLQSTYVDALLERVDKGGRVHTRFNQAGAATGRLSSVEPNLQNIPIRSTLGQKIRRAFVPRQGAVLLAADYSQIDLRALAHLSADPALVDAFTHGGDIHTKTACEIFGVKPDDVDAEMRRRAKAVNFGIVYGQTAFGLSNELGITAQAAKEYIGKYFDRYRGVLDWTQKNLEAARRDLSVRTLLGRIRRLPDLAAKNTAVRQFNERAAGNTPIQGTSADIIKVAMVNIHRKLREAREGKTKDALHAALAKTRLLLQVHDDLLFECPAGAEETVGAWVRREMETAVKLSVPLVVDVKTGKNWQDMEKLA